MWLFCFAIVCVGGVGTTWLLGTHGVQKKALKSPELKLWMVRTTWLLEDKPSSSVTAASAFNHSNFSAAQKHQCLLQISKPFFWNLNNICKLEGAILSQ